MRRFGTAVTAALCMLLLGPIAVVAVVSFSGDPFLQFPPHAWSVRWYGRFWNDGRWRAALGNSLLAAALCSALATGTGVLAAYAFARGRFAARGVLMSLALMPLIVPGIVSAVAIYFLSVRLGLVGNRVWLAACHAALSLPAVLIIAEAALHAVDPALERAAAVHGCTRWGVFRRVVLPLAAPGIASAALFAFLGSFDELVVALFVSGVSGQTLPVRIWNSLTLELEPTIAAVSTLLIAVSAAVLLLDAGLRALSARRGARRST